MAELDVGSLLQTVVSLITMFGLGAIFGFYQGAKLVVRMIGEVQPVVKGFLGGRGKMGIWDLAGMVLSQQKGLGGLLGGKKE